MLLAPLLGPAMGLLGAGLGAAQQSSANKAAERAAAEQNKIQKQQAEAQFARAQQEYELSWQQNLTKFYWEQAATEQLRKVEAQSAVDQASQGARLIWGSIEAYQVQSAGLYDKFVTQEQLRATDVSMAYQQDMAQLAFKNIDITARAGAQVADYLTGVLKNGLQAQERISQAENQVDKLITSLASQEMIDNYTYNAKVLMAAMDGSVAGNQALGKTGGGNSAKALALNAAKRELTSFAEVHLNRGARAAAVGQMNRMMNTEVAQGLAQLATDSAGKAIQAGFTIGKAANDLATNASSAAYQSEVFKKLTMPGFTLANQQYGRELRGLQLGVMDQLYNATLPYRQQEVFDPLMPTKGIAPTYYAPTPVQAQTGGFFGMANAALNGAKAFSPTLFSDVIPRGLSNLFGGGGGLNASNNYATSGVAGNIA